MFEGNLITTLEVGGRWLEWNIGEKKGNEEGWPPKESVSTDDTHKEPNDCKNGEQQQKLLIRELFSFHLKRKA